MLVGVLVEVARSGVRVGVRAAVDVGIEAAGEVSRTPLVTAVPKRIGPPRKEAMIAAVMAGWKVLRCSDLSRCAINDPILRSRWCIIGID